MDIETPPVLVTPNNARDAMGIDVYARARAAGNPVPRFRGQDTVEVRAFGNVDGNGSREVSNVQCNVDSGLYKATILTPANVGVPNYGPDSPSIFVRCETGEFSGSATVDSYNITASQRSNSAAGTGLLGAIIIGAVAAAQIDPNNDEFGYPNIRVTLKERAAQ